MFKKVTQATFDLFIDLEPILAIIWTILTGVTKISECDFFLHQARNIHVVFEPKILFVVISNEKSIEFALLAFLIDADENSGPWTEHNLWTINWFTVFGVRAKTSAFVRSGQMRKIAKLSQTILHVWHAANVVPGKNRWCGSRNESKVVLHGTTPSVAKISLFVSQNRV